mmetsp:Transcript_3821/g.6003  ORF Transcript_3821/g.6003 Transcript_3821/m.6003 type:complete len:459 (+) Transcript_3821:287-1663(+)
MAVSIHSSASHFLVISFFDEITKPNQVTSTPSSYDRLGSYKMSSESRSTTDLKSDLVSLSPALKSYYNNHNVSDVFESCVRFVRLNPRFCAAETLSMLPANSKKIPWLDDQFGFYSIDGKFQLNQSDCFRSGRVYGMDVSSGAAVTVLLSTLYDKKQENDSGKKKGNEILREKRILDLCCAPGLKLCMIADILDESSLVIGVDKSPNRLSLCKAIIKKYHVANDTSGDQPISPGARIQLYCADGTKFGKASASEASQHCLIFDSKVAQEEAKVAGKRKRMNKSARARERKRLKSLAIESEVVSNEDNVSSIEPFDYVLVDAECTTDGSLKHLQEQIKSKIAVPGGTPVDITIDNQQLTNESDLKEMVRLQKALLESGFSLLKSGGILVYSTCSLSSEQNEEVVAWLLKKHENSYLIPVDFQSNEGFIVDGAVTGTVRFVPNDTSKCASGFFVAKVGKR